MPKLWLVEVFVMLVTCTIVFSAEVFWGRFAGPDRNFKRYTALWLVDSVISEKIGY